MGTRLALPSIIGKHFTVAGTKGVIKTSIVYIGTDRVFGFLDSIFGSPLNRLGVNLPLIGRLDLQDVITYMAVAQGFKFKTDTVIAFFVNKFLGQGTANIGSIRGIVSPIISQPGGVSASSGQSVSVTQGMPF